MLKFLNKGISTPIAIAVILLLAVSVGGFTLWQDSETKKEPVKQLEEEITKTEKAVFSEENIEKEGTSKEYKPYIEVLSPNGGEKWVEGERYIITWEQRGLEEESEYICLVGFDKNNSPISVKENWKFPICSTYVSAGEGVLITNEASLEQEKYDWEIPFDLGDRFETIPVSYKIGIPVLESSGKFSGPSEWAGCVSKDESDDCFDILREKETSINQNSSCEYKKGEYEIRVYDSEGRMTGLIDGKVKQEISQSVYMDGEIIIYYPQDYYEYEVFCLREGNYQLGRSSVQDGEETTFNAINIPIFPGQTHRYKIDWKTLAEFENGAELLIDNDGDGLFEKIIPIDGSEFSCEEFILQTK